MLKNMEPLFVKYHTNIIINGHDHAYMRTHPLIGDKVDLTGKQGIVHFTLGAGGNREQHPHGYVHDDPEVWVAKREINEYGFGHLLFANSSHAQFTWVRDGTTEDGIQDSVWIENNWAG
jgi:acid phosphatase type 7